MSDVPEIWRKNYDYGEGLHSGKYKSVEEFLNKKKKERKKRRKQLKALWLESLSTNKTG